MKYALNSTSTSNTPNGTTHTNMILMDYNWDTPRRIKLEEHSDRIEIIYKQKSNVNYTIHPSPLSAERIFKIVYSCIDGEWNKSERIYGNISPAVDESYDFDNRNNQ